MTLYPLRFEPLLRRYIWGGRRLATLLGKSLPAGEDYAESWELVDHHQAQSVVQFGPLQGLSLHELCQRFDEELLGAGNGGDGFPLLFKFIDAQHDLSLQIHRIGVKQKLGSGCTQIRTASAMRACCREGIGSG